MGTVARERGMAEQVEWEVVDTPRAAGKKQAAGDAMRMLLGRWWQWKVAGTALATVLMLVLFATLTGAAVLLFTAGTLISIAVRKAKAWWSTPRGGSGLAKY